jgi:hypothetical protein
MGKICRTHVSMLNVYRVLVGEGEEKIHLEYIDGLIILKGIINK